MTKPVELSPTDLEQFARQGLSPEEGRRQLALLGSPPPSIRLRRPCSLGDGVVALDPRQYSALEARAEAAAEAGRLTVFVPASGAASRMFDAPLAYWESGEKLGASDLERRAGAGDRTAADFVRFLNHLDEFAFRDDLAAALTLQEPRQGQRLETLLAAGDYRGIVRALLFAPGLNFAALPKALVPFHRYPAGTRTAFEEQIVEAARYAADRQGECRLHFTVSPEFQADFDQRLAAVQGRPRIEFSHQDRATDTLALDTTGQPCRLADGSLLFRPGGHGALLSNLAHCGGDLVIIKNIDNVVPSRGQELTARWKKLLVGYLLQLEEEGALRGSPLRVCGVVENQGLPGGGPFWVEDEHGNETPQIVESSQVNTASENQRAIWMASTHFNPVDIVCALRDDRGRPYNLQDYVDPNTAIISTKTSAGRAFRTLEHPGLWNGSMAGWHTIFVEVPAATFAPVKTVLDLLRPEHRSGQP